MFFFFLSALNVTIKDVTPHFYLTWLAHRAGDSWCGAGMRLEASVFKITDVIMTSWQLDNFDVRVFMEAVRILEPPKNLARGRRGFRESDGCEVKPQSRKLQATD